MSVCLFVCLFVVVVVGGGGGGGAAAAAAAVVVVIVVVVYTLFSYKDERFVCSPAKTLRFT